MAVVDMMTGAMVDKEEEEVVDMIVIK